ncbi:MAG: type IV secretory system conjugative DNA transfer family protein [Ruminococcaceae bacterium]|nr:type IV secretory system conjugative DNA transfer family protein [Oscillospiraceae bacterium]
MNTDEYKLGRYVRGNQESRWATMEEVRAAGLYLDLKAEDYPAAGLPLMSDGRVAVVDDKDTHSLIFGATGSKKTRLFCMPMIDMFAKAGESFVVTDPKGELYERTSGLVRSKGYKTVVLNFRDIGYGDQWNPLTLPYELYRGGDREAGISMLNDFVAMIAAREAANSKDVFWGEMASSLALANLLLLMEAAPPEQVNVASLARLCAADNEEPLKELAELMKEDTIAGMNYRGVFVGADNTRRSIYIVLYSMLRLFNTQENLTRMLSGNTVDIRRIGREKTAVYLIVPDEKTTYHFLVTAFIKQAYEVLIGEAQKEPGFRLPVRVNFVLDEFCNMPKIPDMPAMISAARSRNMRYFLVAQSMHQLRGKYGEDADTIKGNCDNWVFLTSKELTLLNEISELCGSIRRADGTERRLISVSELQRLDKEKGEALIMHARQYPHITEMADIDMYETFKGYPAQPMPPFEAKPAQVFSIATLHREVMMGKRPCPFGQPQTFRHNGASLLLDEDDEL